MIDKLRQISFSAPYWFILLLIIPILLYYHFKYLRNKTSGLYINGIKQQLDDKKFHFSPLDYLFLLRLLAIFLIIVGLANPQLVSKVYSKSPSSETDIVFALDISKSMLLEDIKPSRLEALKDVLNRFVTMRSHDPIGVVLYAGESMNWCPLTKNYPLLQSRINKISDVDLPDGTAIGAGLASAVNVLKQEPVKSRVIILLTDGENNAGVINPILAAEFAKRLNIKIYAIGIGSTGYANMPLRGLDGKKYYQKIFVTLNEAALKKMAEISGGAYFIATNSKALENIYAEISKIETKKTKLVATLKYGPVFEWFIEIAIFLLFLEMFLRFTFLRTWPA